jgi:hypothetical protein
VKRLDVDDRPFEHSAEHLDASYSLKSYEDIS